MTREQEPDIRKTIMAFLDHVASNGRLYDSAADPNQGEDQYYYELDAKVIDPLVVDLRRFLAHKSRT